MKGILLAFISFIFLVITSMIAIRFYPEKKYFKPLLIVFAFFAIIYASLFHRLPHDLGFISPAWQIADSKIDFINGFIILFLLFHSFWDVMYASFLTGFSTELLMRFLKEQKQGLTLDKLVEMYQGNGNLMID